MSALTSQDIAALKATGQSLEAAFQVGKNGITDGVVQELQNHLQREPLVKVKLHKSATAEEDTQTLALDLATRARVHLIETRGGTALFHRRPRHKRTAAEF